MVSIQVNNNCDRHRSFGSSNGNDEDGKEYTIQLIGVQVFIKSHKIDVHTVQHQLDRHQQGDQVPAGKQAVHANEKQGRTYKQNMSEWYAVHITFSSIGVEIGVSSGASVLGLVSFLTGVPLGVL